MGLKELVKKEEDRIMHMGLGSILWTVVLFLNISLSLLVFIGFALLLLMDVGSIWADKELLAMLGYALAVFSTATWSFMSNRLSRVWGVIANSSFIIVHILGTRYDFGFKPFDIHPVIILIFFALYGWHLFSTRSEARY